MSKIKERDILKLLDGAASAKKLKKLQKWAASSKKNAADLERYQRIYDELNQLSDYRKVKPKKEWKSFVKTLDFSVSDDQLLSYFDGSASPEERQKIESWKSLSQTNAKEFETFDLILGESGQLKDHKPIDLESEWTSFQKALDDQAKAKLVSIKAEPMPVPLTVSTSDEVTSKPDTQQAPKEVAFVPAAQPTREREKSDNSWMWRSIAVAATLLLLAAFLFTMRPGNGSWFGGDSGNPQELYATFATQENPDIITLSDGSVLTLNEYTSITYFKDVDKIDVREVTIQGKGEFDVKSDPIKPFVVKAPVSGVGVRVLGTKFKLLKHPNYEEVIENLEGSVRAYSLSDTTVNVTLEEGDIYGFDGERFVNLKDAEQDYEGSEYEILYILDYIMEKSEWRVTSAPYSEFDAESVVKINLEQPYEDILEDLRDQADFDYIPLDCNGCYKITKFMPKL